MNVTMNGKPVKVINNARGWYEVEQADGTRVKCRRAALEFATITEVPTNAAPTTEKAMKTTKTTRKASKPAKATKAKAAKKPAKAKASKAHDGAIVRVVNDTEYTYHAAGKTASGAVAYDNGDEVAKMLRGKDIDAVYAITAKAMLKSDKPLKGDFAGCTTADGIERKLRAGLKDANIGRQRMTLGNRLRAALRA